MMPGGPPVEIRGKLHSSDYNDQSTLKVHIADLTDKGKADFSLGARAPDRPAGLRMAKVKVGRYNRVGHVDEMQLQASQAVMPIAIGLFILRFILGRERCLRRIVCGQLPWWRARPMENRCQSGQRCVCAWGQRPLQTGRRFPRHRLGGLQRHGCRTNHVRRLWKPNGGITGGW